MLDLIGKSAKEISVLAPPEKYDRGSYFNIWWSSLCVCSLKKENWIFVKCQEFVWFQNPENKNQLCRVKDNGHLEYFELSQSLLEKFLKGK